MSPIKPPADLARAFAAASGGAGQRLGVAHQRAQIGVFPLLDAPVRQALRLEPPERGLAQRHDLAVARQLRLGGRIAFRERQLGGGLYGAEFGFHDYAASSWNCA